MNEEEEGGRRKIMVETERKREKGLGVLRRMIVGDGGRNRGGGKRWGGIERDESG
jgi:hypothetical protein